MTVNRAQFTSLLEPILAGISNDQSLRRRPSIGDRFFQKSVVSKKSSETYYNRAGLGAFNVKAEGAGVSFTDPIGGSEIKFTHVRRANGYTITQEMLDHDQFREIEKLERDLQIAAMDDLEVARHLVLNSGFSTTDNAAYGFEATGFDGLALFSTAHTRLDSGTNNANRPSTDADLGITALYNALIQFNLWTDHRGRPIISFPEELIIHPNDEMTARELLRSQLKPGTTNNEVNAASGALSILVSPYLTDTDAWFVKGQLINGMSTIWHWDTNAGTRTGQEDDWDKEVVKRKAVHGMSLGHLDWYDWYGTSGAS
jgi:hypothetical protein